MNPCAADKRTGGPKAARRWVKSVSVEEGKSRYTTGRIPDRDYFMSNIFFSATKPLTLRRYRYRPEDRFEASKLTM